MSKYFVLNSLFSPILFQVAHNLLKVPLQVHEKTVHSEDWLMDD